MSPKDIATEFLMLAASGRAKRRSPATWATVSGTTTGTFPATPTRS